MKAGLAYQYSMPAGRAHFGMSYNFKAVHQSASYKYDVSLPFVYDITTVWSIENLTIAQAEPRTRKLV